MYAILAAETPVLTIRAIEITKKNALNSTLAIVVDEAGFDIDE